MVQILSGAGKNSDTFHWTVPAPQVMHSDLQQNSYDTAAVALALHKSLCLSVHEGTNCDILADTANLQAVNPVSEFLAEVNGSTALQSLLLTLMVLVATQPPSHQHTGFRQLCKNKVIIFAIPT